MIHIGDESMKYLSILLIHGLILISSVHCFAQDSDAPQTTTTSDSSSGFSVMPKGESLGVEGAIIDKAAQGYSKQQQSCADKAALAEFICRENTNPEIVKALPIIQAALSALGGGVNDACSSFANAMDIANKALLAYQGTCAAAKATCQFSCSSAEKTLNATQKIVQGQTEQQQPNKKQILESIGEDLDPKTKNSVANHYETCGGYATQLASAFIGAIGVLRSAGQSNKCDKQTSVTPTPTPIDCTIEANKALQYCICKASPRTVGCDSNLDNSANAKSASRVGSAVGTAGTTNSKGASDLGTGGDTFAGGSGGGGDGSGGSAPGAPVGGGAGIDGGGVGGGGPGGGAEKKSSSLNTNILGGESGGGGGGGWGGHGSGSEGNGRGLRQYLPGGQKDPTALAGAGKVAPKDVTSQGGKSNWEKVRDRYRDNKPSLIGN
jgi:hypothetical protein